MKELTNWFGSKTGFTFQVLQKNFPPWWSVFDQEGWNHYFLPSGVLLASKGNVFVFVSDRADVVVWCVIAAGMRRK